MQIRGAAAALVVLLFLYATPALAQAPAERPWRVLILNDADPTLPAFIALDSAIRGALAAPGRHPVNVFAESLDMLRYPESLFEDELVALFAKKYRAQPLDAVVATGTAALDFAEKHGGRLWPDARILFMGVPPEVLQRRRLGPNTTGMPRQLDFGGAAELALRLRPSTRRLVVISGSGDLDRRLAQVAGTQLAPYADRLEIEYWSDASRAEYLRRIARLGRDDAVLYLSIGRDAEGRVFAPVELVRPLATASPAPIYGPFETYLGQGIVAGTLYSFESRGRRMGELVHEALAARPGPPPPLVPSDQPECMADASQLERLGMSVDNLPPGCELRFVPRSLWREYRWYVLGALLVSAAQAALILGMVLERRRRLRAEGEVRQRRAELGRASRLALAGELTASIAHEINQPLGAILANAGAAEALLRRDPGPSDELRAILADIKKADLRASEVIRRVRALVTAHPVAREPVEVNAMLRETLALLRGEAERRGVAIDAVLASGLQTLMVDRVQVQQAVVNLCLNAMEAMAECAPDKRRLEVRTTAAGDGVEIAVADSGPGIPREHLPKVFDSFFTTKPQGTGLGLAITRSIVQAHGGGLRAENLAAGGALFRMVLPAG